MSHRKLMKAINSKKKPWVAGGIEHEKFGDASQWFSRTVGFLKDCSPFYIDGNISSLQDNEIIASVAAMIEADVFKLPAERVYLEVTVDWVQTKEVRADYEIYFKKPAPVGNITPMRMGIMIKEPMIVIGMFFKEAGLQQNDWGTLPMRFSIGSTLDELTPYVEDFVKFDDTDTVASANSLRALYSAAAPVAGWAVYSLITYLCTRGIEIEKVDLPPCRLVSRESPANGYTIVHVKRAMERQHLGGHVDERKRTRLHMRRGHVRHQHFGPKNMHEKIIWIAPCLVGYEEEGWIEHEYLVEKEMIDA